MTRFPTRCLVAAILTTAVLELALGADSTTAAAKQAGSAGKEGPYWVVEDQWTHVTDDPGVLLDRARDDLGKGRTKRAAAAVRKAAAMLDAEATLATGEDRASLKRDASALMAVAAQIEAARLTVPARLDIALLAARADLGTHHELRAAEAWARRDTVAAGRSLAAAARAVDRAWGSIGDTVPDHMRQVLREVESVGDRLSSRADDVAEADWARARNALGQAIEALGKKIESHHDS
jgi:hypothetical protein